MQPPAFPQQGPPPMPQHAMPQPPPLPRQQQQQHMPSAPVAPPVPAAGAFPGNQLSIWYQNQPTVVNKDRFIIGRGKQSSDLTIKDPNVSRQHAMVEFVNGQYYMVDMGSTNGIEYNGQRIARKAVQEGDIFRICDHELRFTYR
jgi:neural Wiskott-Aldrich syndrome protein